MPRDDSRAQRPAGLDLDSSVPDWVVELPWSLAIFESLGIDYTCGGKSLAFACRERRLDPSDILKRLESERERQHKGQA